MRKAGSNPNHAVYATRSSRGLMPTTVTLVGRVRKPVCKCRTKSHATQAGRKKSSFHVKEFKMKCWICANETDYPFRVGTHGRVYCSETCSKGERNASVSECSHEQQSADPQGVLPFGVHVEVREGYSSAQSGR